MGTRVVGKLDKWEDADLGASDFMQIDEGSNTVRIISSPYQTYIHWTLDAAGAKRKVHCAIKDCPICLRGEPAKPNWYVAVINRKTGKPAILEMGPQIFKQIHSLSKKKDKSGKPVWGDPRSYDIDIDRQPKGSQPLYIVSPQPKSPATDEEKQVAKEFLARVDLMKMSAAPTPAELREKLGIAEASEETTTSVSNDFDESESSEPQATTSTEDEDFNFGD